MSFEYLFSRRHSLLADKHHTMERTRSAYSGGAAYINTALVRHIAESVPEFSERQHRAVYLNYPRNIAQLISRYVLSIEPNRQNAASELIEDWSRSGLRTDEVMLQLSTILNCYGWGWLSVDYPAVRSKIDMRTKQQQRIRPFVRALSPFAVTDWCEADGVIQWAIIRETHIDKSDPLQKPAESIRCRLWTATEWVLYEKDESGQITEIGRASHGLGCVPLVKVQEPDGHGMGANHWFEDVVRISDAILNAESEAQMNIIKQMFGLLIIPEGVASAYNNLETEPYSETPALSSREPSQIKGNTLGAAIARSAALWELPEEKGTARYISPSGTETAAIRAEIKELKQSLYEIVGLALQSSSKTQQTAESKAWDNHRVTQFLAGRAVILEQAEKRAWELMALWDSSITVPDVAYSREFSVEDLSTSVTALLDLSTVDAGEEYSRAIALNALALLDKTYRIAPDMFQKITQEISSKSFASLPVPQQVIPGVDDNDNNNNQEV